jgi:DedD protein
MASIRQKISAWFSGIKSEGFSSKLKHRVLGSIVLVALAVIIVPIFFTHNQSAEDPIKLSSRVPPAPVKPQINMNPPPESSPSLEESQKVAESSPPPQSTLTPAPQAVSTPASGGAAVNSSSPPSTTEPVQTLATQLSPDGANSVNTSQIEEDQSTTAVTPASTQTATPTATSPSASVAPKTQAPVLQPVAATTPQPQAVVVKKPSSASKKNNTLTSHENKQKKTDSKKTRLHNLNPAEAWAIQLGTFSSKANATDLIKKLRGQGYSAYLHESTSTTGKLFRVYVGPEIKRSDAQVMTQRLEKLFNLKGMVVKYKI